LARLERVLNSVVERLDGGQDIEIQGLEVTNTFQSQSLAEIRDSSAEILSHAAPESSHSLPAGPSAAPVFVIRDVATEMGLDQKCQAGSKVPSKLDSQDVIHKGLLSEEDAITLLKL